MLGDRILVSLNDAPRETRSGIVLPDASAAMQPRFGRVHSVGLLRGDSGDYAPCLRVNVGETVLLPPRGGFEIDADGERLFVFDSSDALAVVG